ncbi:MAG TPA: serine/threonine-protein kinase [Ktedonobacteraceae bacterium]|nr:serine/threonine-protein kinase [Ktedonobacteraceae bacterium]
MQKRFNQYYLTERIGSKPLRSVYLAHHVKDVSHKALLKIFDAICLALGQESERFLHQVEWIKQLRHAHVVPILDLGVEQGQPYVVSPYLSSGSLRRHLDILSPGCLDLQEALKIISQVGQALSYFHEHAHLHQNIKPENIFFNEQGEVLLADFRLSGFIDVAILNDQSDPRTMYYMAPEQFAGSGSEKSDQYALACLAYELIAGQVPFSAQSYAMMWASHYADVPVPLSNFVPDLPEPIEKVVFKAMAKDPSERYVDISTFLLALENNAFSPAPAIAKPLALSSLDPFSASLAEPLEDMESDVPIETSLPSFPIETSLPSFSFEGSLASAPFGTSLSSNSFGTSLVGTSFGTSLVGVPFGTSLAGNPFEKGLTGESSITSLQSDTLDKKLEGNLYETSLAGNTFIAREEDSLKTGLASDPFEMSLAGNLYETNQEDNSLEEALRGNLYETSQEDNSFEEALRGNLFETSLAGNLFETSQEDNPLEEALGENLVEAILADTPLTTSLLERWERASNKPRANEARTTDTAARRTRKGQNLSSNTDTWLFAAIDTPAERTHSGPLSIGHLFRSIKYAIPSLWSGKRRPSGLKRWLLRLVGYLGSLVSAVRTASRRGLLRLVGYLEGLVSAVRTASRRGLLVLSKQSASLLGLWERISSKRGANSGMRIEKATAIGAPEVDAHVNPFLVGRNSQSRRYSIPGLWFRQDRNFSAPVLWLVLVMTIIVLIGGLVSDTLLTSKSSGVIKSANQHQQHQTVINTKNVPIDTKLIAPHVLAMPTSKDNRSASLSASISQPSQTSLTGSYADYF